MEQRHDRAELQMYQSLSLEQKVALSQQRIKEWYEAWEGNVYVSFSGGKDSTVLLDLVRDMYPEVPAVYVDTGLEYPEIKDFVKTMENVTILRPKLTFRQVIEKYGYPVATKEQAAFVYEYRNTGSEKLKDIRLNGNKWGRGKISKCWLQLIDAPFPVSDYCCDVMKKKPVKQYEKETGYYPFIATMACESSQRKSNWEMYGCNAFEKKRPTSQPMSFWTEQDVLNYILSKGLNYASVYGDILKDENGNYYTTGCDRTGCMFCMFGVHLEDEPNRFQRMKETHPKLYEYCMRPWDEGGLGLDEVLTYINVEH